MKKTFILTLLISISSLLSAQVNNPISWQFSQKETAKNTYELTFKASIEVGWHLYSINMDDDGPVKTTFTFEETNGVEFIDSITSQSKEIRQHDETFGMEIGYYENEAVFTRIIKIDKPTTVKGIIEYMSCNDETCTPPQETEFEFKLDIEKDTAVASAADSDSESHNLLWFFFYAIFMGLLAIMTPCVFPMIPMTVSFFLKGENSKKKARRNALFYGLSIIGIYTLIGTLVSIIFGPSIANWLSTHWIPNLIFFAVFMIFAFSFFGMFEIVMPSRLVNKVDKNADKGGLAGAFFMALTLVLVSFSCTGPVVGAILVQSAGGAVLKPVIGMLGFSLAFALPFGLLAFFPQWLNNLPKSGGWLNSVKVVLGFIELALGLKFLSIADQTYHWGILDREIYIAIWIVLSALLGLYLLGKLKFSHDSDVNHVSVPRLLLSVAAFSFMVYLVPGMFGAPLKAISGYLPPMETHDFDIHRIVREEIGLQSSNFTSQSQPTNELCSEPKYDDFLELPHGLNAYFDYKQGLQCAKEQGKPIFLDFTGHGCVNCREMEANVWSDLRVLERLKNNFVIIALYVDDKTKLPQEDWVISSYDGKTKKTLGQINADFQISRFQVNAQPYYVLLDHNGNMLTKPKTRDLNPDNFVKFLDEGIFQFAADSQQ